MSGNAGACHRCRFWRMLPDLVAQPLGECRRRAPLIPDTGTYVLFTPQRRWPITEACDDCGEFERRGRHTRGS